MFWCFSCNNVTVTNATLSKNNNIAVMFKTSSSTNITNLNITNSYEGINLNNSSSTSITGNTIVKSSNVGINIGGTSNSNTISGNTLNSNFAALSLITPSLSNILSGNDFLYNENNFTLTNQSSNVTYSNNTFRHSLNKDARMLTFVEPATRSKGLNDTVAFDVSLFDGGGTSCSSCTYTVSTAPSETVSSSQVGNNVTGSFTVTRKGTYSLIFTVTDGSGNTSKRNYLYFVNSNGSRTTRNYFRYLTATDGQIRGNGLDSQVLSTTAPTGFEAFWCSGWAQSAVGDIPDFPLSNLSTIDMSTSYQAQVSSYTGVQRFSKYGSLPSSASATSTLATSTAYSTLNSGFSNLNWGMDYPQSWYDVSVKIGQNTSTVLLYVTSSSTVPGYVDFTYSYTDTPSIRSISNTNTIVLSATAPTNATTSSIVILENLASTATTTSIVIPSFNIAFSSGTSTISSTGTTTLTASLSANATSSFSAIPLELTPSSGSIDVTVSSWDSSTKIWTESTETHAATSDHTISSLTPNTNYYLAIDGAATSTYTSNSSGIVTFTYSGGYSSHTFNFFTDTTSPTVSLTAPTDGATVSGSSVALTANASDDIGVYGVQFKLDTNTLIGSEDTTLAYGVTWDTTSVADGSHTLIAVVRDAVGNYATSSAVTVTVNNTPVLVSGAGSSSSGGRSIYSPYFNPNLATIAIPCPLGFVCTPNPVNSLTVSYARSLTIGGQGNDVKNLQKYLNSRGFVVAKTGAGSPGYETTLFGPLTQKALAKFQKANGIYPSIGYFGPVTRAFILSHQ